MCDAPLAKKLLILFNIVFWLGGAALLGIGVWMKADPTIVHYLNIVNIHQDAALINHAGLIFIIAGGAACIVGIIGCCGALRESQGLLFMYVVLVLVIMCAELTGAILALVYKTQVEGSLEASMYKQVKEDYVPGSETEEAWDFLQQTMECCGSSNYTDYDNSTWWREHRNSSSTQVPASCCVEGAYAQCQTDAGNLVADSEALHTTGCHSAMIGWFSQHSLILTILGFAVAGAQVLGFMSACCLRNALRGKSA